MRVGLKKFLIVSSALVLSAGILSSSLYLWIIPSVVSSKFTSTQATKIAKKYLNVDLLIQDMKLKTSFSPDVAFTLGNLELKKDNKNILILSGIDTEFSLQEFFTKRLIVKKVIADNIFVDTNKIMELFPQEEQPKEEVKSDFVLDCYTTIFGIKKCLIVFSSPDFNINFNAKNIKLDRTQERKYLHFDFDLDMLKGKDKICISADDKNSIYMGNQELHIDNFPIGVDKSKILINAFASRKKGYYLDISSKNFSARDIADIVSSNILIPNGKELLAPVCDVKGNVDFKLHLTKKNIEGHIDVKESEFRVVDLMKMPVKITQGKIDVGNTDIKLYDFKGFYNNKKINHFKFDGNIKDYWKTCDTKIISNVFVTNDFFENYVSKILNMPIYLVGDAGSQLTITSKNGSLDLLWYFLLKENEGFKFGEQPLVLKKYQTLFKLDLSVVKNIIKINKLDYFITNELKKGMTPVLSFNTNIDMADNMKMLDFDLKIPRPLPSEFLNFLAGQKIFEGGEVSGEMYIDNHSNVAKMDGEVNLDKVKIPSERIYIKNAKLNAKDNIIWAKADGGIKRAKYDFDGYFINELKLPIVAKDLRLAIDNIDLERFLMANSSQNSTINQEAQNANVKVTEDDFVFPKNTLVIEKCLFELAKGKYKEVNFSNIKADMTLDKDGNLDIKSNHFNIAEGTSTLKVKANFAKQNYYLRLGVRDVNSDIMASAILGLPREITGKGKGLIELSTDSSLKLNGSIKFDIKDGSIEKVGYVEYLLKAASLFRNPLAMISPVTLSDLVNIPDGRFDDINGELVLKNNVIEKMMIKSSAPALASFIIGRYNLETNDAMLRIYTKISDKGQGFAGVLRNISLNGIAGKISPSARNESNYYSTELSLIPKLENEKTSQVFLTKVDGDVINFNFLSSLKRIK